jgi:hypothetical protein
MTKLFSKSRALVLAFVVSLVCSSSAFGTATILIQNVDPVGVGFNDTTPVAPVGGNGGTTLGQQRLNAFQFAANIWGATLSSGPTITVRASWSALPCTSTTATLGSAGTSSIRRNFLNAPFASTWYSVALANALSGTDLNGAAAEINAEFNVNLGTTGCLDGKPWYYGLDNNHGANRINLVTVLLHEFSHGLGFQSFTDETTGQLASGFPSIFDRYLFDNSTNKTWIQMTDAERLASAINTNHLVWNGPQVVTDASFLTVGKDSSGRPLMFAPNPLDGGSSVSHWDRTASPNLLMEPNINTNLTHSVIAPQDLTYSLMKDIGWCTTCPAPQPTPTPPPPPANDNFASAQTVTGCSGTVNGSTFSATQQAGEPRHDPLGTLGSGSVWFYWQAPSSGVAVITTAGSDYDTMLGVYTGNSVNGLTVVQQVNGTPGKSDDISTNNKTSIVTFAATAGTFYRIAVDGWGSDQGNYFMNWSLNGCIATPAPVVLTELGTNRAVAFDSVTQVRGPFPITGLFNFSADRHTRVMLFTTALGSDLSGISVQAQGISLPIERVGTLTGVNNASYVIVRLVDGLPAGDLSMTLSLRGLTSNTAILSIAP